MRKTRKWILLSLLALLLLFIVFRTVAGRKSDAVNVSVETVKRRTLTETVSASGKLYPETDIRIAAPIAGEVTELNVSEGDTVVKGQVLARIQGDRSGSVTPKVSLPAGVPPGFESLVQGMQRPPASGASSAVVRAPVSGTVLGLSVKKGERMGLTSSDLMRIADLSVLEVRVDVNENNIIKVAVGDSADVEVEAYNKRKFKGVVTSITNGTSKRDAQALLSGDATAFEVHIRLIPSSYNDLYNTTRRNLPFRPGMTARAEIKTARREAALSVPAGAVVSRSKGSGESLDEAQKEKGKDENEAEESSVADELEEVVFVVKSDNTVEKRVVLTGIQDMAYFEITKGVQEGEKVVTAPYEAVSKTLHDGQKITAVSRDKLYQSK